MTKDLPNVILVVLDTLRADYSLGIIKLLKKYGFTSYNNVITPYPGTLPTHASIVTGLYPLLHGAHESRNKKIPNIKLQIQESLLNIELSKLGYTTHLISANEFVWPEFGFVGFDRFYDILWVPSKKRLLTDDEAKIFQEFDNKFEAIHYLLINKKFKTFGNATIEFIFNWTYLQSLARLKKWPIEKGSTKFLRISKDLSWDECPHFIFVNLMEVHEPYHIFDSGGIIATLKDKVKPYIIRRWKIGYSRQVKYLSHKLLYFIKILKKNDVFDNSLIIITSDHGQLLGEDNRLGHGVFLDDELLRVPLLIKHPKDSEYEIENNILNDNRYVSLTSIKKYILHGIDSGIYSNGNLYSDYVFSEVYGIPFPYTLFSEKELNLIKHLDKYRIAIYYKNFKGIFNVTDWKFEKIISYDPRIEITEDIVNHMKKEVIKFLKMATLAKVPKIKL